MFGSEINAVDFFVRQAETHFGQAALARVREVALRITGRLPPAYSSDPWQRPNVFCPGIGAKPWYEVSEVPEAIALETHSDVIWYELEGALRSGVINLRAHSQQILVAQGGWSDINIKLGNRAGPFAQCFPTTVKLLASFSRVGEMALFSVVTSESHIKAHCGPWNLRLTIHLGLAIPEHAFLRVGGEIRRWRVGRCLVFDDSFEHEVWNRTAHARVVLIVDVWHPDLTDIEVYVLNKISNIIVR